MVMHWVVVADAARARVFEAGPLVDRLEEIAALVHPASRLHADDLVSDDRGRTMGAPGQPRGAMDERRDPQEREKDVFARSVAEHLADGLDRGEYERLIVAAAPAFLGALRKALPKSVSDRIVAEISRDWSKVPSHALPKRVKAQLPVDARL